MNPIPDGARRLAYYQALMSDSLGSMSHRRLRTTLGEYEGAPQPRKKPAQSAAKTAPHEGAGREQQQNHRVWATARTRRVG